MENRQVHQQRSQGKGWDLSESAIERILDLLISLIVMCVILSWCLVTFSVKEHTIAIVLTPLLIYFTLSSPGMRLRMKERTSMLLVTDISAVFNIALCCLFADYVYFTEPNNTLLKMVFGMASAFILCLYLSRVKAMFYLIVPAVFAINAVMFTFWNVGILIGILMTFLMPLPYCMITFSHPYYFGFGRVKVKGVYRRYPEAVAKRMRAKQAEERKAERRERIRQGSKRF